MARGTQIHWVQVDDWWVKQKHMDNTWYCMGYLFDLFASHGMGEGYFVMIPVDLIEINRSGDALWG